MRYTHIISAVIQIYNTEFPNINRGDICVTLDITYLYVALLQPRLLNGNEEIILEAS